MCFTCLIRFFFRSVSGFVQTASSLQQTLQDVYVTFVIESDTSIDDIQCRICVVNNLLFQNVGFWFFISVLCSG